MLQLQYYHNFVAADDAAYRVEIWRDSAATLEAEEIEIAADGVTIEWAEAKKIEDPVQGSSATLRLISLRDRQFYDLFAVDYGEVMLHIYRDGAIYWTGTLDPELFEEPYAYKDTYITEATFADLAMLDYRYWERHGSISIGEIVTECLTEAGLGDLPLRKIVSTQCSVSADEIFSPFECFIDADNFYDEDGDAMTLREVLEEVLRPFALRLLQRGGEIVIYDLHALYAVPTEPLRWYSNDAMLGADAIYNSIELTFSPYADQTILSATLDPDEDVADATNRVVIQGVTDKYSTSAMPGTNLASLEAFTLYYTDYGGTRKNLTALGGARFFRIDPVFSGSKEAGVLYAISSGGTFEPNAGTISSGLVNSGNFFFWEATPDTIIRAARVFVSADAADLTNKTQLCLSLTAMFDPRRNPFESADFFVDHESDEKAYNRQEKYGVFAYIPVLIYLCDATGDRKYVYLNNVERVGADEDSIFGWQKIADLPEGTLHRSWLAYYDVNESDKGTMFGWQKNGRIVGKATRVISESWKRKNNGEYISFPPESGYIEVNVCAGIIFHDEDKKQLSYSHKIYSPAQGLIAYKELELRVVPANGTDDMEDIDIVSTAYINKSAREELSLDTIVGSVESFAKAPASKAVLRNASGVQITKFKRRAWVPRIEEVLLDTAISQFAARKATLEGTAFLQPSFAPVEDASMTGRFVMAEEVQNLMRSTSELRLVEFVEDQNNDIEEVK